MSVELTEAGGSIRCSWPGVIFLTPCGRFYHPTLQIRKPRFLEARTRSWLQSHGLNSTACCLCSEAQEAWDQESTGLKCLGGRTQSWGEFLASSGVLSLSSLLSLSPSRSPLSLSNMVVISWMWPLSTQNMAQETKQLNSKFYLILIDFHEIEIQWSPLICGFSFHGDWWSSVAQNC